MKHEIVLRSLVNPERIVLTLAADEPEAEDFEHVRFRLVTFLHSCLRNGALVDEYIYRNFNGQTILVGFRLQTDYSYSIRKAIKTEKLERGRRADG